MVEFKQQQQKSREIEGSRENFWNCGTGAVETPDAFARGQNALMRV